MTFKKLRFLIIYNILENHKTLKTLSYLLTIKCLANFQDQESRSKD